MSTHDVFMYIHTTHTHSRSGARRGDPPWLGPRSPSQGVCGSGCTSASVDAADVRCVQLGSPPNAIVTRVPGDHTAQRDASRFATSASTEPSSLQLVGRELN